MNLMLVMAWGSAPMITSPTVSSRVVVARVKAVLRRSGALAGEASGAGAGLTFNGWRLDTTRCELYNPQQQAIPLTQGEYGLLLALAQKNARRVLNREQLLALTHNESTEVFDRTIDVLIMRLQHKIELNPHQPTLIKTLRGLGYVFSADITREGGVGRVCCQPAVDFIWRREFTFFIKVTLWVNLWQQN